MVRWFRYRRRRRYYRRRYSSYRKRTYRKTLYKSKNMSKSNIVKVDYTAPVSIATPSPSANTSAVGTMSLGTMLVNSAMYKSLSNVYDQVRIVSCRLQIQLVYGPTSSSGSIFCAYDKTGFVSGASIEQIQTYGSYKVGTPRTIGNDPPTLVYYLPRNAIETSQWYDSKKLSAMLNTLSFGYVGSIASQSPQSMQFTVTLSANCAFRGSRLDTTTATGI